MFWFPISELEFSAMNLIFYIFFWIVVALPDPNGKKYLKLARMLFSKDVSLDVADACFESTASCRNFLRKQKVPVSFFESVAKSFVDDVCNLNKTKSKSFEISLMEVSLPSAQSSTNLWKLAQSTNDNLQVTMSLDRKNKSAVFLDVPIEKVLCTRELLMISQGWTLEKMNETSVVPIAKELLLRTYDSIEICRSYELCLEALDFLNSTEKEHVAKLISNSLKVEEFPRKNYFSFNNSKKGEMLKNYAHFVDEVDFDIECSNLNSTEIKKMVSFPHVHFVNVLKP